MKFISSTLITLALSTIAALAVPTSPANALQKRSEKCRITTDSSRCRRTPHLNADIIGQFSIGATPTFTCVSTGDPVNGVTNWDRTTITIKGTAIPCFVSDTLVALPCPNGLSTCH
ncbi:hypothetical protein DFH09DRAFT_1155859 [Mycena vulgaris]|nr:hypothetical protein DFH09DRAFT_1155859 [Mycena vulgaris]